MAASWNMGYNTDMQYTFGYYREMSPLYGRFIFLAKGYEYPDMTHGTACELAFGQGISVAIHAAAGTATWYGNDFNPLHANFANHMANKAGIKADFSDASFEEFLKRDDLPMFDYICLHGIWSWISPENQQFIVDFIKKRLKVGGVLYISYNVSPGFMAFEPVRHLMYEFNKENMAPGMDPVEKQKTLSDFINGIMDLNPGILLAQPGLAARAKDAMKKDYHYVLAEYLNEYWDITHFTDLAKKLDSSKVSFVCSASASEMLDNLNLTADQQKFLAPLRNSTNLYEEARDLIVNQQFRRDFFAKGARRMNDDQRLMQLGNTGFVLCVKPSDIKYTFDSRLGQAHLKHSLYDPLIELMSDYKVRTLFELRKELIDKIPNPDILFNCIMMLVISNQLAPAIKPSEITSQSKKQCQAFNNAVINNELPVRINYLASPVTQCGFVLNDLQILLLSFYLKNKNVDKAALEKIASDYFTTSGITITQNDVKESGEKTQAEIIHTAVDEMFENLPVLKGLLVI